ncbi:MAG: endonuclease domain-containing protein [Bacteroidia bacterium]|nr:endonuclease domain-containing protein [Bacteroidia bacterium]
MPSKFLVQAASIRCRELRQRQTNAEIHMWDLLRNRKCHGVKFYRQRAIFYDVGGRQSFYIADFYSHELNLIIELDGPIHDDTRYYDSIRDDTLENLGFRVLRFPNHIALHQTDIILNAIKQLTQSDSSPSPLAERGPGVRRGGEAGGEAGGEDGGEARAKRLPPLQSHSIDTAFPSFRTRPFRRHRIPNARRLR